MTYITNFIWLLFAHYFGDIAFQSSWQADNKGKYWYVMLSHCMIWAGSISIALQFLGIFSISKALGLFLGHYIMDSWKARQPKTPENWWMIYPDQAFHIFQLFIVFTA
ncbi:MAG: DUF3307 domain-containing protein [Patescibacteria group bacterium]|jgi:hypothetical protein